jgi:ribosomal protein L33
MPNCDVDPPIPSLTFSYSELSHKICSDHFIYSTQIQQRPITARVSVIKYMEMTLRVTIHLGHDTTPLGNWFHFQSVVPSSSSTCSGPMLHTWPHLHPPDWPINLSSQSCTGHTAPRYVPLPVLSGILLKALDPLKWRHYGPLKCCELITQQCPKRTEDSKI